MASKDARKILAIGTRIAGERIPTRDIMTNRTLQRIKLQDRSGKRTQWLGGGPEYGEFVFPGIRERRHVCVSRQIPTRRVRSEYELSCRPDSPMGNDRHVKHLLGPSLQYKTSRVFPTRGSNVRRLFKSSASCEVSDARRVAVMSTSGYAFRRKSV